jgi:Co/Zn/Cd efflux system component
VGDANERSVWLCSRNDAIGNVAVMLAAAGVWGTSAAWPDLVVAAILAGLFLFSSLKSSVNHALNSGLAQLSLLMQGLEKPHSEPSTGNDDAGC